MPLLMTHRKRQTSDMTQGNIYYQILSFAFPVFLSQVFQLLYSTADTLIVGRFLGTEALAAVSSSGNLIALIISFSVGIGMGAGVAISRHFGAKEYEQVSNAIHTDLLFSLLCGFLLTVVGVILTPILLGWMNTAPEVLPQAIEYFRFYFSGVLAVILYNICRGIMTALGDSQRPLYYLIISSLLNVGLDFLFIAVFKWGVWSAAVATVISQAASVVLCLMYLFKKDSPFPVQIQRLRMHRDILREMVRYGLPSSVQNSVIDFANVIVQTQINSFGALAMAAYGTHSKIEGLGFLPIVSFGMAATTFVSQNLGAREYERARKGVRFTILSTVILAELIGLAVYWGASFFLSLFDKTAGVISFGVQQSRIVSPFYFLLAFSHSVAAVCRGAGKAYVPMFIMLSIWCLLRIVYISLVTYFFHDIQLIYWAYPLTWGLSSILYLIYYLRSDWLHGFEK